MPSFNGKKRGDPLANSPSRGTLVAAQRGSQSEQQAFEVFYQRYGPRLWSIILLANLPVSFSEDILVNTIVAAWQQRVSYPLDLPL